MLRYKQSPQIQTNNDMEMLLEIYDNHLWLNFTKDDIQKAESVTENYPNQTGKNQAFINYLCLIIFEKYLREYFSDDDDTQINCDWIKMFQLWHFVHGGAININEKRLILIPNENIDIEGFEIQKEWVDIPNLAGDYYLPVQVDMEAKYLHIWGFVSRKTLTQKAEFESIYRVYIADGHWIIDQFDTLMIALDLVNDEKGEINNLLPLEENEVKELIKTLSNPSPYSPRLEVKFEKWAGLLNDENRLEELARSMNKNKLIKLSDWLTGIVTEGWEKLEKFMLNFNEELTPIYRGERNQVVETLYKQSKISLPFRGIKEPEALVYLIEQTKDEYIRWKAAEYLWNIAPNHPKSAISRVMNITGNLKEHKIALMVSILLKLDGKIAVLLRMYPVNKTNTLPGDLCLEVFDETGKNIPGLKAISRRKPQDNYIQLYFIADYGDRFGVNINFEEVTITEKFMI